jgi:uncharacterized Ntn-hydrolase superfamily protein
MRNFYLIILAIVISFYSIGQDTFSICAVDIVTGEVGSAGASCVYVPNQGVMIISDVHPGVGVIHTQAWYNAQNQQFAHNLMDEGAHPQYIIDQLVANDAQGDPTIRQYGIVDINNGLPRTAAYTGVNTDDYKNHIIGGYYTIQGNILLGQEILDSIEARFLGAEGELVCRLMAALQGANVPGADERCLADGTSSIGAFLRVARPDDDENDLYFEINLPSVNEGVDPIDSLQTLVDLWGGCDFTDVAEYRKLNVNIYPNPASNIVHFALSGKRDFKASTLMIYDKYGHLLIKREGIKETSISLDITDYAAGLYFYRFDFRDGKKVQGKFVKN